jgi:hypothetical protein
MIMKDLRRIFGNGRGIMTSAMPIVMALLLCPLSAQVQAQTTVALDTQPQSVLGAAYSERSYVVVVGNGIPVGTLDKVELAQIFTGKSSVWLNGSPVRVSILVRQHPATMYFVHDFLEMTLNEYFDRVAAHNQSGKGNRIQELPTEVVVKVTVMERQGSIGYIGVDRSLASSKLQVIPLR